MQAHILSLHISSTPGDQRSEHFFLKVRSHVAYQIKRNGAQITMQAHILSLHTLNLWSGLKGKNSEYSHVAYQSRMKCRLT